MASEVTRSLDMNYNRVISVNIQDLIMLYSTIRKTNMEGSIHVVSVNLQDRMKVYGTIRETNMEENIHVVSVNLQDLIKV